MTDYTPAMSRPWSKLEIRLRGIPDPDLKLRFRFTTYRPSKLVHTPWDPPCKFWITLGKRTIWAAPSDRHSGDGATLEYAARRSPGWLAETAAAYLQVPRSELITWQPDWLAWGLVDLLKACDRRIGKRHWPQLRQTLTDPVALAILCQRGGLGPRQHRLGGRTARECRHAD